MEDVDNLLLDEQHVMLNFTSPAYVVCAFTKLLVVY